MAFFSSARAWRLRRVLLSMGWAWCLLSVLLAWWDGVGRWVEPGREVEVGVKLWIFWALWALLPWWCAAVLGLGQRSAGALWWRWVLWLGLSLGAYGSVVEPLSLVVREHRLVLPGPVAKPRLRIALVADVHAGLFVRHWQLERLVDRLNALQVDAVVVAGDWVYHPQRDLDAVFAPLARLRHPVWGVLGNHDTEAPGPPLAQALRQSLQRHGVRVLDGRRMQAQGWEVVGLSDLWGGNPRADVARWVASKPTAVPRLVLAHQPDTAALLPEGGASLVVSGHTHGGQIRVPWLTRQWVLPMVSAHGWYKGLYSTPGGALFVTSGTGTIGLPVRLGVVPRIDVLTLE